MSKLLTFAALVLLAVPAFANIPERINTRYVNNIAVMPDYRAYLEARQDDYQAHLSGCTVQELEGLQAPVSVHTQSRSIREGTVFKFTGADGQYVFCKVEQLSKF